MGGEVLLDTNIVVAVMQRDPSVMNRIAAASEVFVSMVTVGELYFGALKSTRQAENLQAVDEIVSRIAVLDCNSDTAQMYAGIKFQLQSKGKPIPDNDVRIAALARQYDLTLLTRDKHFQYIDHVAIEVG
jgi:tRNA(fMet)-specific endonuclease VapC